MVWRFSLLVKSTPTLELRDFNLVFRDPIGMIKKRILGQLFLLPSPSPNDTWFLLNIAVTTLVSLFYTKSIGDNNVDAHRIFNSQVSTLEVHLVSGIILIEWKIMCS